MNHVQRKLLQRAISCKGPYRRPQTALLLRYKSDTPPESNDEPIKYENKKEQWNESFLTPYLRKYPALLKSAQFIYTGLGLYAKQTEAIRSSKYWYMACAERDIVESDFLYKQCRIPQTFHSWFQITNLHVWLLTVRFRALPKPHGRYFLQALIDFFFADIEERLRAVLGPRISERTIVTYMKEYRQLWNGSQIALDVGLVGGDWELAGAVWRNVFDARGWDLGGKRGDDGEPAPPPTNELGIGTGRIAEIAQHDLALQDESLAELPYQVYLFTAYLRRELKRLESVSDEDILHNIGVGKFGRIGEPGEDDVPKGKITAEESSKWTRLEFVNRE